MVKEYYNDTLTKEIDWQLIGGNYNKALALSEDYIIRYPDDVLGPTYKARALAGIGRVEEAIEIFEDVLTHAIFHDTSCRGTFHTNYGLALAKTDYKEKAMEELYNAINCEQSDNKYNALKARIALINMLCSKERYDEALKVVDSAKIDNSALSIKRAYIYLSTGKTNEALRVLKKTQEIDNPATNQQLHFCLGRCYFNKEQLDKAMEEFNKCLNYKSKLYYNANAYIATIKYRQNDLHECIKYANVALIAPTCEYEAYKSLFKAYMKMGDFPKAKVILDSMKFGHTYDFFNCYYQYMTKNYEEAMKIARKILAIDRGNYFTEILKTYINCLVRLGKYEEAKYVLDYTKDDLEPGYYYCDGSYIYHKLGLVLEGHEPYYSARQVYNYKESKAIEHIKSNHTEGFEFSSFNSEEELEELFYRIKEQLDNYQSIHSYVFDQYLIPYSGVGFDKEGTCNTLVVVTLPDSHNIITMYPLSGTDIHLEEERTTSKVVKARLSQTDKFNARMDKFKEKCGKK